MKDIDKIIVYYFIIYILLKKIKKLKENND